ncbi:hypothetical protein A71_258 [Escherichia phage A7_1]|uniref:Uncharacterized protein n=1 Tax=Escherichia phage A5-4 TaxID=2996162 RepID=A0AAE9PWC5_9CAUD|nr:hypothetical protein A71_258 [Escherichia phage A7_1]UZZ64341.1 hypothetical protein A54_101 [Escherichia phage A5-4]
MPYKIDNSTKLTFVSTIFFTSFTSFFPGTLYRFSQFNTSIAISVEGV